MTSVDGTSVEVNPAKDGAQQIVAAAQGSHDRVTGLAGRIAAACAAKPWGRDQAGQACDAALTSVGTQVQRTPTNVAAILHVGTILSTAADNTQATDEAAAARVQQSAASAVGGVHPAGS